ncbi:MAG TPA: hypothetical protein DD412_02270 [Holosporales bacterium]|nr:hypothetical protein [Holosporales bacterium]
MVHLSLFLKNLFLSALFALSITQTFASARDTKPISSDEKDDVTLKSNRAVINSMKELLPYLTKKGIKLGPNVAIYIDNDDAICSPRFNINPEVEGDLVPLQFLSCPDLGRTYDDVLKAAAALLHTEDHSTSLIDCEKNLLQAHLDVCNWNREPWRHLEPIPLELDALTAFLSVARANHTRLKICSGLPFTFNKVAFFGRHQKALGFKTCSLEDYGYGMHETNDYLYAPKSKPARILQDLVKPHVISGDSSDVDASSASSESHTGIDTVILIDNAPTACTSFLGGMIPTNLVKYGLSPKTRIITIRYDFFRKMITPEKIAAEYKLWVHFLEALEEIRRAEEARRFSVLGSLELNADDGYDTNPDLSPLTVSTEGTPDRLTSSREGEIREPEEQEEPDPSLDLDDAGDVFEEKDPRLSPPEDDQKDN